MLQLEKHQEKIVFFSKEKTPEKKQLNNNFLYYSKPDSNCKSIDNFNMLKIHSIEINYSPVK